MALFSQILGKILQRCINNTKIIERRNIKRWVAPTLNELYRRRIKAGPEPVKPRSSYLEWNYEAEVFAFGKRLGEEFDRNVLKQALTHRSYVTARKDKGCGLDHEEAPCNQNMIREGDELISQCIVDELSKIYPNDVVMALHDYLTSEKMLAHVARHMGLADIVLTSEFPVEDSTLANTFKSVVAALNNSQGIKKVQMFVKDFVLSHLTGKEVYDIWNPSKPLEYLKQLLEKKGIQEMEPRLCNHSATNTILANYQVGLYYEQKLLGIGWGESIEIAKETAALDAIQRIHNEK